MSAYKTFQTYILSVCPSVLVNFIFTCLFCYWEAVYSGRSASKALFSKSKHAVWISVIFIIYKKNGLTFSDRIMQTIRVLVEISVYFLSKDNNDVFFFIFLLVRRVPTNSQPETFVCDGISFLLMSRHKKSIYEVLYRHNCTETYNSLSWFYC